MPLGFLFLRSPTQDLDHQFSNTVSVGNLASLLLCCYHLDLSFLHDVRYEEKLHKFSWVKRRDWFFNPYFFIFLKTSLLVSFKTETESIHLKFKLFLSVFFFQKTVFVFCKKDCGCSRKNVFFLFYLNYYS